jgi:CRP-like cAMP-binding protein
MELDTPKGVGGGRSLAAVDETSVVIEEDKYGSKVCTLSSGDTFGEKGIINDIQTWKNTAVAIDHSRLLYVHKEDFMQIYRENCREVQFAPELCSSLLRKDPAERTEAEVKVLSQLTRPLKFFTQLSPEVSQRILAAARHVGFEGEDVVYSAEDPVERFYMIVSGTVKITNSANHEMLLNKGDCFGNEDLEKAKPLRSQTAFAMTDVELLYLTKVEFGYLLKNQKSVIYNATACRAILEKTPTDRSQKEVDTLITMSTRIQFFAQLPPNLVTDICKTMHVQTFKPTEVICFQGDIGTTFFIILAGSVSIHIDDMSVKSEANMPSSPQKGKSQEAASFGACVGNLFSGDTFGEKAFAEGTNHCRSATIMSREFTELIVVDGKHASQLTKMNITFAPKYCIDILKSPLSSRDENNLIVLKDFCKNIMFFKQLPDRVMTNFCACMQYTFLPEMSPVFFEGDAASHFYVILSGSVSVHKQEKEEGEDMVNLNCNNENFSVDSVGCCVAVLVSGDTFGEVGIMSTDAGTRSATIITREDTEMCVIARSSFLEAANRAEKGSTKKPRKLEVATGDVSVPAASPTNAASSPDNSRRGSHFMDLSNIHFQPSLCKKALMNVRGKRTENEIMNIFRMVKTNSSFFGELAEPLLKDVCQVMGHDQLEAESPVVVQNDPGETCFMILSGKVEIRIMFAREGDSGGALNDTDKPMDAAALAEAMLAERERKYGKLIGHMELGECFGEKALQEGVSIRAASIIAVEQTELITVHRADFQRALRRFERKISKLSTTGTAIDGQTAKELKKLITKKFSSDVWRTGGKQQKFRKMLDKAIETNKELFPQNTKELLDTLMGEVQPNQHEAGEHIYEQGVKASSLFIVLSGKVALYDENNVHVCEVVPGEVIGTLPMLWNCQNYLLSARALENTATMAVSKEFYLDKWTPYFVPDFTNAAWFIKRFPVFQELAMNSLAALHWTGVKKTFTRHSFIPQDLVTSSFCFIVSGECQLKAGPNANLKTMESVSIIGQGQFFDDISSMFMNRKRRKRKKHIALQCSTETVSCTCPDIYSHQYCCLVGSFF